MHNESLMSILAKIAKVFFFLLYSIIKALVLIGEITEKILLIPFKIIFFGFNHLRQGFAYCGKVIAALDKKIKRVSKKVEREEKEANYTPIALLSEHATIPQEQIEIKTEPTIPEVKVIETSTTASVAETIQPEQKTTVNLLHTLLARILIFYRTISNALIAFGKSFIRVVKPKEIITTIGKTITAVVKFPIRAIRYVFRAAIRALTKVSFLKKPVTTSVQTASRSVRVFNKSWFRLFRMSFTSSFKYFVFGFLFCLTVIFVYQSYEFVKNLPSPKNIGKVNYQQSTHLYDRNGKLLYEIYRDQNRTPIKLKDLPPYVAQASIAIEDKTFYNHHGIAIVGGMLRAIKDTLRSGELQGGSTLTQQLVKSALLTPERTLDRKLKEIFLAVWTERIYTKDQILEMYLNQVPYGGSAYGIEEAAKTYFGKPAKQLTIAEAALLAGLPRAPSIYAPYINPQLALGRRNDVLHRMYELGYITEDQKRTALDTKIAVKPPKTAIRAPHFVFYTKAQLEKEYGIQKVEEGGFKVTTSLDLDVQEEAEKILREELEKIKGLNVSNGGILVMKPKTGEILAMVGSVDYFAQPYGADNVTIRLRQPGSTLKPAVYALGLEKGLTAASTYNDSPIAIRISDIETYKPVNYDGKFHGRVTMRAALANSYNIPAVLAVQALGVTEFVNFAQRMGIDTWPDPTRFGLSIALGGGEVTMVDLAQVFGVFANEGMRVEPTSILKMNDHEGNTLYEHVPKAIKVLNEGIAYIISDILADNPARTPAFGPNSALVIPNHKVSVKTGTTDNKKDNWTVGYTPEYLVAVWVGNNNGDPMNPYLTSGITGAAPIWQRVMMYLLQNKVKDPASIQFKKPENIIEKPCFGNPREVFLVGTENNAPCSAPVQRFQPGQPGQNQGQGQRPPGQQQGR